VRAYLATASAGAFLPQRHEALLVLLDHCLLSTVVTTLSALLDTRPQRAGIALAGLLHLLEAQRALAEGEQA
jgi:hypothetical protein